ncbi:MAG: Mov34/MPN/PAD-1 family protein, partial [Pirellulaceae bacterium]|nr:Mov34/MPN/PAD-1 family protein [Pirellulaceae bacterium]
MIQPIPKPAPARSGTSTGSALGEIFDDALPIFVHESVLEEILEFSERDVSRERGGFLVGGLHEDGRTYVEVRNFLPAADTRSRAASLTFTHETWSRLNKEVEMRFSDEVVVGWQHTHPDFG